jgi:hypothetical protein
MPSPRQVHRQFVPNPLSLFAFSEELELHFHMSAVLNAFFKTFRLEAAPVLEKVLESREDT